MYAAYAHMTSAAVTVNQEVKLGDVIGYTGNTGNASTMTGQDQNLHFEIRNNALTGKGLIDRISPFELYKRCPIKEPIIRGSY